jgi:hypothetical protein
MKLIWGGLVVRMGELEKCVPDFGAKPEGKRAFRRPGRR